MVIMVIMVIDNKYRYLGITIYEMYMVINGYGKTKAIL